MVIRTLLVALFAWQGGALLAQFATGFRPFVQPPQRIALSWDMFSVPIQRCQIVWDRPVQLNGRWVRSLHALSPPLEGDRVFDTVADYRQVARAAAATAAPEAGVGFVLHCLLPGGRRLQERDRGP